MKIFNANITCQVLDFLCQSLKKTRDYQSANRQIFDVSGIMDFFDNQADIEKLKEKISELKDMVEDPDRVEYGDFQTNTDLATKVVSFLRNNSSNPRVVIEPTCGKGNFIVASLKAFNKLENVYGVEIYKPYVWETKFNILHYFVTKAPSHKPEIKIFHFNVFDFDFNQIAQQHLFDEVLIIGNPPWITNAKLGSLNSGNLPVKTNFKKHSGFDSITGKGNFDIGEYITLMMFDVFQNMKGYFAFLVKNAVVKNVVYYQMSRSYKISDLQQNLIDSKKEFNVSVEASLFFCKLNSPPEYDCKASDFYGNSDYANKFGWVLDKFVSDVERYGEVGDIDGECPFEWRQGIKHDCSAVMELERADVCANVVEEGRFINGLDQEIYLEEDLVFGLLKSSDLKNAVTNSTRKFVIVTQKKVGQETLYMQIKYPKIYGYLAQNKAQFDRRKSNIYKNKPPFSIFGIGDYSFKPFKVAISGLYKRYKFNLILPQNNKPIMLDDTCYFIGFDKLEYAIYSLILLNSLKTREFLQAIAFSDAKRMFTKDILMRIDLLKLALSFTEREIQQGIDVLNESYGLNIQIGLWDDFIKIMTPVQARQMNIFAHKT